MAIQTGIGFVGALPPPEIVIDLPLASVTPTLQGLTTSLGSGAGSLPSGWNSTEYNASAILFYDNWTGYADTAAVQAGVSASYGSGGSAATGLAKLNSDTIFPNACIIVTQDYGDDNPSGQGHSPELRRSFTANDNVWLRSAFRFIGTGHPSFSATADWTPQGNYPLNWANSYKMFFITWSGGASNRMEVEWSNANSLLLGLGMSSVTSRTEQNLVTLFGQPSGTILFPPNGAAPSGMKTGAEWWEMIFHFKKLSSTHCVARFWMRQLTTGSGILYNPQSYYFNGLDWSNCTGTIALAATVALGANRNKTAPNDGVYTDVWPAGGPQKGVHIIRGPSMVLDGDIEIDPFGIGSHGGGPY